LPATSGDEYVLDRGEPNSVLASCRDEQAGSLRSPEDRNPRSIHYDTRVLNANFPNAV
jgi:hypothetical protein